MNTQKIIAIAAKTRLVTLNMGKWMAHKLHKDESAKVNAAHHTEKVARVHITLTDSPLLAGIRQLQDDLYARHIGLDMTHPSLMDGMRIVNPGREVAHAQMVREAADRQRELVDQFLAEYPAIKWTAKDSMNGLFVPAHWPEVADLRKKFYITVAYFSCPTDGAWADWLGEAFDNAERELADSIRDALKHLIVTCKGDGKLYQSVFGNLQTILDAVPHANLTALPSIDQVAAAAADLGKLDAEVLRKDVKARRTAAQKAEALLNAFNI